MATPPPPGVYVPIPTFFQPRSTSSIAVNSPLDLTTHKAHALHLVRSGITGLVVLGSTGEGIHVTNAERAQLLSSLRDVLTDAGYKNYPLIVGTAAQNVDEVVQQLIAAERCGVQWGLCLVPGYFAGAASQEGIIEWFRAVADRSPLPIMIYHYPGVTNNVKVLPSTFEALSQHTNIVGCKLSHGDISAHIQIASSPRIGHSNFHTFTGLGQQLLPAMTIGCHGTIDGSAGFFPKSVVRLYFLCVRKSCSEEQLKERRQLQYKLSAVEEIVVKYGTLGIKEAVSRILGMGERDGTRLPLLGGLPGGDAEWETWKDVMGELEAVEKSL